MGYTGKNYSWLMAFVKEKLARRANAEDEIRGTFLKHPMSCVTPLHWTKLELANNVARSCWLSSRFFGESTRKPASFQMGEALIFCDSC